MSRRTKILLKYWTLYGLGCGVLAFWAPTSGLPILVRIVPTGIFALALVHWTTN